MRSAREREASREMFSREEMSTHNSRGEEVGGEGGLAGWRSRNPISSCRFHSRPDACSSNPLGGDAQFP
jgi:hypothetical protein